MYSFFLPSARGRACTRRLPKALTGLPYKVYLQKIFWPHLGPHIAY